MSRQIINYLDLTNNNLTAQSLFNTSLGTDGTVSQDAAGLNLTSKVFTTTVPQGPLGRLDYFKLALSTNPTTLPTTGTTFFETCLSGKQHFTPTDVSTGTVVVGSTCATTCNVTGTTASLIPPVFSSRVTNIKADPRLATSGLLMYDPDNDFVMGILTTDQAYFAIHGILGFQAIAQSLGTGDATLPDGKSLPFTFNTRNVTGAPCSLACNPVTATVPRRAHLSVQFLATRESHDPINDFRSLGIGINTTRDYIEWLVNGERTIIHHGIGRPGPEQYRLLNMRHNNATTSVVPTRMQAIFFTGDMLDLAQPVNSLGNWVQDSTSTTNNNYSHLVALECPEQYSNVNPQENGTYQALGPLAFASPEDLLTDRLFGQGASMTVRFLAILNSVSDEDTLAASLCSGVLPSSSCSSSSSETNECDVVDNSTEDVDCDACAPSSAVNGTGGNGTAAVTARNPNSVLSQRAAAYRARMVGVQRRY